MTCKFLHLQETIAALTTSVVRAAIAFVLLAAFTSRGIAQSGSAPRANVLSVEANLFRGSVSYSRFASPTWEVGAGLGFGFPQLDVTLFRGKRDDFRDYVHLGAFARHHYGRRALLEFGARLGVADYEPCTASDCWPHLYVGPSVLFAVGGERFKVGPRLSFGAITSPSGGLNGYASVSPVNLLASWRW